MFVPWVILVERDDVDLIRHFRFYLTERGNFPIQARLSASMIKADGEIVFTTADVQDFIFESTRSRWKIGKYVSDTEQQREMKALAPNAAITIELDLCIVGMEVISTVCKELGSKKRAVAVDGFPTGEFSTTDVSTSWEIVSKDSDVYHIRTVKIENCSGKMELIKKEGHIDSESFSINVHGEETKWFIRTRQGRDDDFDSGYYCRGNERRWSHVYKERDLESEEYLSMELILEKGSCPIGTDTVVHIVKEDGSCMEEQRRYGCYVENGDKGKGLIWCENQLQEKGLLQNNTLTIELDLRIAGIKPFSISGGQKPEKLSKDFQLSSMFNSEELSDCVIECDGRTFRCHKLILAGRSPVFKAMFRNNMAESIGSKITVEDLSGEVMENLIGYIYTGRVAALEDQAEGLLVAADKYDLGGLKAVCEDAIAKTLNADNAVDLLLLADGYNAIQLKEHVMNYISGRKIGICQRPENIEKLARNHTILAELLAIIGI